MIQRASETNVTVTEVKQEFEKVYETAIKTLFSSGQTELKIHFPLSVFISLYSLKKTNPCLTHYNFFKYKSFRT